MELIGVSGAVRGNVAQGASVAGRLRNRKCERSVVRKMQSRERSVDPGRFVLMMGEVEYQCIVRRLTPGAVTLGGVPVVAVRGELDSPDNIVLEIKEELPVVTGFRRTVSEYFRDLPPAEPVADIAIVACASLLEEAGQETYGQDDYS